MRTSFARYSGARSRVEIEPLMRLLYSDPYHVTEQLLRQALDYKQRVGVIEAMTKIASSRYAGTPAGRQFAGCSQVPCRHSWSGVPTTP